MSSQQIKEQIIEVIRNSAYGASGEIRIDCPECQGSQRKTLGINADSGLWQCMRCGIKGNLNNGNGKKPAAQWIWENSSPCSTHPYLQEKQVKSNGLKEDKYGNLIVPLEQHGQISTLQFIRPEKPTDPDQPRKFLLSKEKGGTKKGSYFVLSGNHSTVYICEGYATAASVHEATGNTAVMAVDAGNMKSVAQAIQGKYPNSEFVFAADNDHHGKGLEKAREAAQAVGGKVSMPEQEGWDFNDLHMGKGLETVREQLKVFQKEQAPEEHRKQVFGFIHVGDLSCTPPDWLAKDLVESNSLTALYGDPTTGKSFLSLDLACCVATGKDFHGFKVKSGPVGYIAGEGRNGLARRIRAWEIRNNIDLSESPLYISTGPTGLCDSDATDQVISALDQTKAPPKLIVIDTLARNFGPGDENSTRDMTLFIQAADKLRTRYGCTILLVHHTGHGDKTRERGAFALRGGLDSSYRLEKSPSGTVQLLPVKMKDAELPSPLAFQLRAVELGMLDEYGREVTSAILNRVEYEPEPKPTKAGRGKWQQIALEQLQRLEREHRERLEQGGFDPEQARVSVDVWRDACINQGMSRQSWNNTKHSLSDRGAVILEDKFVKTR